MSNENGSVVEKGVVEENEAYRITRTRTSKAKGKDKEYERH